MTPRADLLNEIDKTSVIEMNSGCGYKMKVVGIGKAAFKGADGKPFVLEDVLLVPELKGNLISLRQMGIAGVCTATNGHETFTGKLGNRVLWDLNENKDVHDELWHVLVVPWKEVVHVKQNVVCSCKRECATAAETIKELNVKVEILVQQLQQVNVRLAAAEKRNVFGADEKNGADVKGSIIEAATEDKEKEVPKSDTREE
ncbi:unnamed protein product [Closterium sp. NIES-53]